MGGYTLSTTIQLLEDPSEVWNRVYPCSRWLMLYGKACICSCARSCVPYPLKVVRHARLLPHAVWLNRSAAFRPCVLSPCGFAAPGRILDEGEFHQCCRAGAVYEHSACGCNRR